MTTPIDDRSAWLDNVILGVAAVPDLIVWGLYYAIRFAIGLIALV